MEKDSEGKIVMPKYCGECPRNCLLEAPGCMRGMEKAREYYIAMREAGQIK